MDWLKVTNDPEILLALRTQYRASKTPEFARHPLIQAAKQVLPFPIHFYQRNKLKIRRGDAPGDVLYVEKGLYLGPESQKPDANHVLWHELSHALVALPQGKLDYPNFQADFDDEILTCRIEVWLGFISGYYSLEKVHWVIREYNFTNEIDYVRGGLFGCDQFTQESVLAFLDRGRLESHKSPAARKIAQKFGGYSKKALNRKFAQALM